MGIRSIQNEIGRRLKRLRQEQNLSQEVVAAEVKISRDHLSNLENGKYPINIKTLYKLSEFYKVDLKFFF
jgi:transcriptional regulator with XRE-family HTH domain